MNSYLEGRFGKLLIFVGFCWAVHVITNNYTALANVRIPLGGPVELCGLGLILWLHSLYLKSVRDR